MLQIQTLGHADAQKAIAAIQAELGRRGKVAAIAVVDAGGEVIATLRIDGTALSCVNNATNKAFTSADGSSGGYRQGGAASGDGV